MDIICAKCDIHFTSIEDARGHNGHCKGTAMNEIIHWIPSPIVKITPEEWADMMVAINEKTPMENIPTSASVAIPAPIPSPMPTPIGLIENKNDKVITEKPTRKIKRYTAQQIKNIGGKRFLKVRAKRIGLLLLLSIGWIPLVNYMITAPKLWIVVAPLILVLLNIGWGYFQSRKLFYERVKKNPELLE
jgi:hypothetical protein